MTPDRATYVERLLGMVPAMKATHTVKFDSILSHYSGIALEDITSPRDIDQVVRAFICWAPPYSVILRVQWILYC